MKIDHLNTGYRFTWYVRGSLFKPDDILSNISAHSIPQKEENGNHITLGGVDTFDHASVVYVW